ncbi:hypothetical protein [Rufibacter ruber]|uniref:hypothetical protein n=1 Tax=Rufibacter ruber TaxID=1783499 RepID=UPI00082EEEFE|nr:hypothetical protein [Rufibacter ruber]
MALTLTRQPNFIQAAYNKIEFGFSKSDYQVGDRAFCEIYRIASHNITETQPASGGQLLTTLSIGGKGDGTYVFDVSSVLQYAFADYALPDPNLAFQRDTSAYVGYYVKAGVLTFNGTLQVKTVEYTSSVKFALRTALDLEGTENLEDYLADYTAPVNYLTNQPNGSDIRLDQRGLLSVLVLNDRYGIDKELNLVASKFYKDGSSVLNTVVTTGPVTEGGIYTFSVAPSLIEPDAAKRAQLKRYEVYIDYTNSGSKNYYDEGYAIGQTAGSTKSYSLPACTVEMTAADCSDYQTGYSDGYADTVIHYDQGYSEGLADSTGGTPQDNSCGVRTGINCSAYQNGYSAGYAEGEHRKQFYQDGYNEGFADGGNNQASNNACPNGTTTEQCAAYQQGYSEGYPDGKAVYDDGYATGQSDAQNAVAKKTAAPSYYTGASATYWLNGYNAGYATVNTVNMTLYSEQDNGNFYDFTLEFTASKASSSFYDIHYTISPTHTGNQSVSMTANGTSRRMGYSMGKSEFEQMLTITLQNSQFGDYVKGSNTVVTVTIPALDEIPRDWYQEGYSEGYQDAINGSPYHPNPPLDELMSIEDNDAYNAGYNAGWQNGGGIGGPGGI